MKVRLQKAMADSGLCSRRRAENMIREGRVAVNGSVATLGDSADPSLDDIRVDGLSLSQAEKVYFALNKPPGYECTLDSTGGKPLVTELVSTQARIFPVGRLDVDSRGLLLLTNDGEFSNSVIHPSSSLEKEYIVKVAGLVPDDGLEKLASGILLDCELTRPCRVEAVSRDRDLTTIRFILHQGRKRQIRRMLESLGFEVLDLVRIRIGPMELGNLKEGRCRQLTSGELANLNAMLGERARHHSVGNGT